jgi:hypothetical protein
MKCSGLIFFLLISLQSKAEAQLQDSLVIMCNGTYSISSGNSNMAIDPAGGGRVVSFKLNDYEFLTGKDIHEKNYGSTFWSSPQSYWNWPPPPVLDMKPYTAVNDGNIIKVTSEKDPVTGFQFVKEFSNSKSNRMNLTYSIVNISKEIKNAAPWEVSRVNKEGLFFFPMGQGSIGKKSFEEARTEIIDGIAWYKDEKEKPENHQLSIADGSEGWMAYAIDGKLFIKKFPDIKPDMFAPGEAEISFYISPEADYIEIEVQGKYETIQPGERTTWKIEWIGMDIPPNIEVKKGSKELVKFVREIIK